MTRKAARGRKPAARARTSAARGQARTTTRTGRKTSSARASKTATPTRAGGPAAGHHEIKAKRGTAPAAGRPAQTVDAEAMHEPLPAAQHEDDEEMDWLGEDEDPRSQIVEDDDEWEPQSDDEW